MKVRFWRCSASIRGIAEPDAEHGLVPARPHPQALVWIFGATVIRSRAGRRAAAQAADDDGFAERRLFVGTRKAVIDFHPARTGAAFEIARHHLARGAAVQELMVHVHQVLVHETVVAGDVLAESPRLVGGVSRCADPRQRGGGGGCAGPHEDQARRARNRDSGGHRSAACLCRDRERRRRRPTRRSASHDSRSGWCSHRRFLSTAAPAGARSGLPARRQAPVSGPHQHDRLARELRGIGLAGLYFARPCDRIPVIRMRADIAKVARMPPARRYPASSSLPRHAPARAGRDAAP